MMGRRCGDQASLFYEFRLEDRIPKDHLLRRIDGFVTPVVTDIHERLEPYYSEIGRPSIDPELMIRMLLVGHCYGLRSERRLTQEVALHLAYRWFCRLDLDDKVPHHSTFSENQLNRFRESDVFPHIFEGVVAACMAAGLVKGEGSPLMPASWRPTPVVTTARRRTRSHGPNPNARRARSRNISRRSKLRTKAESRPQAAEGDLTQ